MVERRSLSADERALIRWILDQQTVEGIEALKAQIDTATIVSGIYPTMIDIEIAGDPTRSALADGPLPGYVLVGPPGAEIGELIVWVKGGLLSALEYAWFTDDRPEALPSIDSLRLW